MNKVILTILFAFLSSIIYSQENCNNGIDDDGDGLIDLNDTECNCVGSSTIVPSLIPNPSFEDYDYCPNQISQLDAASIWIQATIPTTDYFNTCGYVNNAGMTPFPDGNAAVGAFFASGWQEYLGACLLSPMLAGTNYQIKFNIASKPADPFVNLGNNGVITYGPINVTLYGSTNCNNLPVSTYGCPSNANPNWIVLGYVNYVPNGNWSELTISFNPTVNINAIILGSPCQLPVEYAWINNNYAPYFYFDNLILNESTVFNSNSVSINSSGDFCTNNVVLNSTVTNPGTYTYQWYNNGIAILGATNNFLALSTYIPSASYSLKITDSLNCYISNAMNVAALVPNKPIVSSPISYCQFDNTIALNATGNNLLWYTTATGGSGSTTAPIPSSQTSGTFTYYVSQTCVLESLRESISVIINPKLTPNFNISNTLCYGEIAPSLNLTSLNNIVGTWSPTTVDNLNDGVYTFTPNSQFCAFNSSINIDVSQPILFTINGQCDKGIYYLNAIANNGSFPANLNFEWHDYNGNSIGNNEPTIDITSIVESSFEIEDFPLTYGLTITDSNGCDYSKEYTVEKVFCRIPKGISPNNDNKNDFFDLRGLNVKQLNIFNRYGVLVYQKENYTTEWTGKSSSGNELPDGAYYYHIEFNDGDSPKTGWVYVTRE
jgi:gliding motility-associated-like protein